jgi:iron complex outermembrane recepter protein
MLMINTPSANFTSPPAPVPTTLTPVRPILTPVRPIMTPSIKPVPPGAEASAKFAEGALQYAQMSSRIACFVAFLTYFAMPSGHSQTTPALDTIPNILLPNAVITQQVANKYIPLPHTIIPAAALTRDDGWQLAPALNRVAGVYMHAGTYSTNRIVVRGIGSRSTFGTTKLRAYLDDMPLTSGDGETSIEDIDLSLLGEVRIYKGPTASLYGAGLGGMVQLRMLQPENKDQLVKKHRFTATTGLTVGSFGLKRSASTIRYQDKKTFVWANWNILYSDGWRENSSYFRFGFAGMVRHDWGRAGVTTVFLNDGTHLDAHIPSSLNINDYRDRPEIANPAWLNVRGNEHHDKSLFSLGHTVVLRHFGELALSNQTSVFSKVRNSDENRPFGYLIDTSVTTGVRSQISLRKRGLEGMSFPLAAIGVEHYAEDYDALILAFTPPPVGTTTKVNEKRLVTNLFGQSYFAPTSKMRMLVGVNVNMTNYHSVNVVSDTTLQRDTGAIAFAPILSPHIGITYQLKQAWQLFATVSHGFSAPTIPETRKADGTINPNIKAETGLNRELGARWQSAWIQAELSLHDMTVKNLLVAERIGPDQYEGANAGKTRHQGLELDARTTRPLGFNGFLTYTATHYRFVDFTHRGQVYDGNPLTGVAPHHVQAGLDYKRKSGVFALLNAQYLSAYSIKDDNSIKSEAYALAHVQAGYRRSFGRWSVDLRGGLQNLFDTHYASMILINATSFNGALPRYYYPGAPRNWYTSVQVSTRF